ncbi:MAG TPA: hypothetical protein VFX98_13785 [Longimicrobiaceae bacterium]|nr:hypothetical protein [Longimicrobiaceae bacterium]
MDLSELMPRLVVVKLRGHPSLVLRPLARQDIQSLEKNLRQLASDPRELTRAVLQDQLAAESEASQQTLSKLSNGVLRRVAYEWAVAQFNLATSLPNAPRRAFEVFRDAVQRRVKKHQASEVAMKKASAPMLGFSIRGFESFVRRFSELSEFVRTRQSAVEALSQIDAVRRMTNIYPSPAILDLQKSIEPLLRLQRETQAFADVVNRTSELIPTYLRLQPFHSERIFAALPDISQITPTWLLDLERAFQEAEADAEGSGFEFALGYVSHANWRGSGKIEKRVRSAAITNRLLGLTRSHDFEEELMETVRGSAILSSRGKIVTAALRAHVRREYVMSIPVLLAQVEGVFTDLLVLKKEAIRRKGKTLPLVSGRPRTKQQKGKTVPSPYAGMKEKIELSPLKNDPATREVAGFLLDAFVSQRNAILHGERVDYGRAKLSVQMLINLYILSQVLNAAERGEF